MMNKPLLEIKNLKKFYHNKKNSITAIENVSFNINENEFITIIGPSGCGKSTILSILAGLECESFGKIFTKKKLVFGYMLQKDLLFPWLTVYENCLLGLKIMKKISQDTKDNVIRMLNEYGLSDFINSYPDSLSGGMRQRVSLIRTLAINPDVLLLDEPLSALDTQTRLEICDDLYRIIKKEGKTVVMVTHDISEAISLSDKVIVLTSRPAKIKKIYNILFNNKSIPSENRNKIEFNYYFNLIKEDFSDEYR